jgi:hypothetical protein
LKNNKAKVPKKSKYSEKRCLKDDAINNCEYERLREKFVSLREKYQQQHYHARIEEAIKTDPKTFFRYVDLKKKCVANHQLNILKIELSGKLSLGSYKIDFGPSKANLKYF